MSACIRTRRRRRPSSPGLDAAARARARRACRGLTLVEILVAVTLLLFGLLGFTHSILRSVATNESTREAALAGEAARQVLETLQATPFDEVFRLYNTFPGDDPAGPGTAPGEGFDVAGLVAAEDDPDGRVGQILFPVPDAIPGMLREDTVNAALGMPRDLNGDGKVDGFDHSTDYRLLPVVVRLEWRGTNGLTRAEFRTFLGDYR